MWGNEVPPSTGNQVKARETTAKATENKKFMKSGLQKYIEYWRNGMAKCEEPEPYCGPANEAPETPFNPWRDIRPGS